MTTALLDGVRVLVVEDDYLIADDIASEVEAAGAEVVGPIPTLRHALEAADHEPRIDVAVLDINLRGEMVWPLADKLMQRQVPIIFATGYDARIIPPPYDQLARCEKPVAAERVIEAIRRLAA